MRGKISKALSIILAVVLVLTTCAAAFTVSFAEGVELIYYVGTVTSETPDGSATNPYATVTDAVTAANAAAVLGAGDTLNVVALNDVSWGVAGTPTHAYNLVVKSDTTAVALTCANGTTMGGHTTLDNINATVSGTSGALYLYRYDFTLTKTASLTTAYFMLGRGSTTGGAGAGQNVVINGSLSCSKRITLGNDWYNVTYTGAVNLTVNVPTHAFEINLGCGNGFASYTDVNINVLAAAGVSITSNKDGSGNLRYSISGNVQVINSTSTAIGLDDGGLADIDDSQKWIINNTTSFGEALDFSSTAGKFAVGAAYNVTATNSDATVTVGTTVDGQEKVLDLTALGAGVYTASVEKLPETIDYYVQNGGTGDGASSETPAATIAEAVATAIANEVTVIDTLRVNVLDITAVEWGTVPDHAFKLLLTSDVVGAGVVNVDRLGGDTTVEKISFKTVTTLHTNGHNFILKDTASYSSSAVSAWFAVGDTNHATYSDSINMEFNAATGPRYIQLGTDAKYVIYNNDINLTFNNASYNPTLRLGSNWTASTAFNSNFNIFIKDAAGFAIGDTNSGRGYVIGSNAALNIINTDQSLTLTAANNASTVFPSAQIWMINDKSGLENLIAPTSEKGKFTVTVPETHIVTVTKPDGSTATVESGTLTLEAGISSFTAKRLPTAFDCYVGTVTSESPDGSAGNPYATVTDAITATNAAGVVEASDTLNIIALNDISWGATSTPVHAYGIVVKSKTTPVALAITSGTVLSGNTTFDNINATVSGASGALYLYRYDFTLTETASLVSPYFMFGRNNTSGSAEDGQKVVINGSLVNSKGITMGNDWNNVTYTGPVDFTLNDPEHSFIVNFGCSNGTATYADVNIKVKAVAGVTFKSIKNGETLRYVLNGNLTIINSTATSIGIDDGGLADIDDSQKWIINNGTGHELELSETAGKYTFSEDVILHAYKGGEKVAESDGNILDLTKGGAGAYSIVEYRPAKAFEYTITDGEKTIADMISEAITDGAIEGDTVVINLTGTTTTYYGKPQEHLFDVVIKSTQNTPVNFTASDTNYNGIVGDTVFDGVKIEGNTMITFDGNNVEFTEDTTLSGINWLVAGNNSSSDIYEDEQKLIFANALGSGIRIMLASDWKTPTFKQDINIKVSNTNSTPRIVFGTNAAPKYEGNINIDIGNASIYSVEANANAVFGGAVQIISKNALSDTVYAALDGLTVAGGVYTVYDKTGEDVEIAFGESAGEFAMPSDKSYRAVRVADKTYADYRDGLLDLKAIGVGHYYVCVPYEYSGEQTEYADYINYRNSLNGQKPLNNTAAKLNNKESINVVYYGGSVTAGAGASVADTTSWRGRIGSWLEVNFPQSNITNINSAIGGTSTYLGSYRLNQAVIEQNPDLLFVEFSINDYYDRSTDAKTSMQLETIIRQVREELPECDIITVLVTDKDNAQNAKNDILHAQAKVHEALSAEYGIPTIHVGRALADKLPENWNEEDWKVYFPVKDNGSVDIVHPNDTGYKVYADVISEFLANCLLGNTTADTVVNHTVPKMVSDQLLNGNIKLYKMNSAVSDYSAANGGSAFDLQLGGIYPHFEGKFHFDQTSDVLVMQFEGTELALLDHHTSTFSLNVQIDDGAVNQVKLSDILPTILASGLKSGTHKAKIWPAFTDGAGEWTNVYGLFGRDENSSTVRGSKEVVVYVQNGATDGDGSEAAPYATIGEAVTGANALLAKDTLCVKVLGTTAVEWGTVPTHAFDMTVTSDIQGAGVSGVDALSGNTRFSNIEIISSTDAPLYTHGHSIWLESTVTYSRTNNYIEFTGGSSAQTYDNDIEVLYAIPGTKYLEFGSYWRGAAYNGDITITVDNAAAAPKINFGSAGRTTDAFNGNINLIYKSSTNFNLGLSVCDFGPDAAIQIVNSTNLTIDENTGILPSITNNTAGNPVKKWIINDSTDIDGFKISLTDKNGTFDVTVPNTHEVVVTKPDGSTANVTSGEITLPDGVSTFTAVKVPAMADYYVGTTTSDAPDGSMGNPYATAGDAINAAIVAGYEAIDTVNVLVLEGDVVDWGTPNAYAFRLNVATSGTTKATINMVNGTLLTGDVDFNNVKVIVEGAYGALYLGGHDVNFGKDANLTVRYIGFNKYSGATELSGQTVVFNNPESYTRITSSNGATSAVTYKGDVNIHFNNTAANFVYRLTSDNGATTYKGNLNLNFARAKSIGIAESAGSATATVEGAVQVIVPANATIDETSKSYIISEANLANGYWYIVDDCMERGLLDFTADAGVYTVKKDVKVYATHSDGTVEESKKGILDLSKKQGDWTITTKEYFEDFDNITAEDFENDWVYNANYDVNSLEDGKLKIQSLDGIYNKSAVVRNRNINTQNQFVSVDVKGEGFTFLYGGASLYARVNNQSFNNASTYYELVVTGGRIRLLKFSGTYNGSIAIYDSDFDTSRLKGRVPTPNEFSFNGDHTYRIGLSVVDDPESNSVAYVTVVVRNLTTNSVIFHETFKDTARYEGSGIGLAATGSNDESGGHFCHAYFDNLYVSTEAFRETDIKSENGDINYDGVYDIRDLVYTDEYISGLVEEGEFNRRVADKDYSDVIDSDDIATIRYEIVSDALVNEFSLKGFADDEADALRENIINSPDTDYNVSGTTYYVSSFATSGNGTKGSPWSLAQLNAEVNDANITSGDAVLFERGSVFTLVQPYADTSLDTTYTYYNYVSAKSGVIYGAYTGSHGSEKPVFKDSPRDYADLTWTETEEGSNIWVYDDAFGDFYIGADAADNGVVNMIFNDGAQIGQRRSFTGVYDGEGNVSELYTLLTNGHFTTDIENGLLYLYCDKGNPAEVYDSIDVVRGIGGILIKNHADNVTIDNLAFIGFGHSAVMGLHGNDAITVTNCISGYAGGMIRQNTQDDNDFARLGGAMGVWNGGVDLRYENNWIYHTYDTAISPQGDANANYDNFTVIGNLFEYNNADIEFFDIGTNTTTSMDGWVISNNIMRFTSLGWGSREADGLRGIEGVIRASTKGANKVNIEFVGNIIDTPGMEIFSITNTTAYTDDVTDAIFLFGVGYGLGGEEPLVIGDNTYYFNPYVRNVTRITEGYMVYDTDGETILTDSGTRYATDEETFVASIKAVDTSNTSKCYWLGKLIG